MEAARLEAREERLANNEIIFRTVNEGIQQLGFSHHGSNDDYEFICECAATGCLDKIELTPREYEHIRANGKHFLVVPGHENVEVEFIVETFAKYVIVEKDGHAGIVAEQADPRDNDSLH
jgi:hypothetical protein